MKRTKDLVLPFKRYQRTSLEWVLANPYAAVFLDPGLGKTLIVLAAFWVLRRMGLVNFLLVVAPLGPCYEVWPREVEKWGFNFKVAVLHGPEKDRLVREAADVYVVNYEGLEWLYRNIKALRRWGVGWLVADESTKVKNSSSNRHRWLKAILGMFGRRTILTGTPAPNGYVDLWGQMYMVDLGQRLGRFFTHYRNRYFVRLDVYLWALQNKAAEKKVQDAIKDVCIRFSDRELGLKPVTPVYRTVTLPPAAREVYAGLERDFVAALPSGYTVASNSGVLAGKLRQVANGGLYDDRHRAHQLHDAKAESVADLWEELSGQSLIVAYEFDHDLARLRKKFPKAPVIKGGMTPAQRNAVLKDFDEGRGDQPLLAQIVTLSLGYNLQRNCHRICFHSLTFNLEDYIQLMRRVHRLGQRKRVIAYHIIARDTVDDKVVLPVLRHKNRSQQMLLDALRSYQA